MGLDQYAYAKASLDSEEKEELFYWRKHNRLHGWMEDLYRDRGNQVTEEGFGNSFNCVPVELTLSDIEQLEAHVTNKALPETGGFFFGNDSFGWTDDEGNEFANGDYYYKEDDLKFIGLARKALQKGKKVFYDSWW